MRDRLCGLPELRDTSGNLSSRADNVFGVNETFGYDAVNRLTGSTIGGTTKTISYDLGGNITYKSDVGTYNYTGSGTPQPHAIQSITGGINFESGPSGAISGPSYTYDADGNMTFGGNPATGAGRAITYTVNNQPAMIGYGTSSGSYSIITYSYDSSYRRYKQAAVDATIVYWNAADVLSEEITASGVTTWNNYISAEGRTVAIAVGTASSATLEYLHGDHLGSTIAMTSASGVVIERDAYDPWGKRRNTNGADDTYDTVVSNTTRGYTGAEHVNDVSLVNLNARLYDPQIGKFLGTDPLVSAPYGSQGWNRFAYVGNNPLNGTDPSGEWGFGLTAAFSVEGGNILAGAGVTGAVGYGLFGGGTAGLNAGGFASGGAFVGGPNFGANSPASPSGGVTGTTSAGGLYAGGGGGGFLTNATSASDLGGPFDTYTINTPVASIQIGISGGTWIVSLTCGVPPCGIGVGAAGSSYPTTTCTFDSGCGGTTGDTNSNTPTMTPKPALTGPISSNDGNDKGAGKNVTGGALGGNGGIRLDGVGDGPSGEGGGGSVSIIDLGNGPVELGGQK